MHHIVGQLAAAALARASADKEEGSDEKAALLDRLVAREMELLESIMDGRSALMPSKPHALCPTKPYAICPSELSSQHVYTYYIHIVYTSPYTPQL